MQLTFDQLLPQFPFDSVFWHALEISAHSTAGRAVGAPVGAALGAPVGDTQRPQVLRQFTFDQLLPQFPFDSVLWHALEISAHSTAGRAVGAALGAPVGNTQ